MTTKSELDHSETMSTSYYRPYTSEPIRDDTYEVPQEYGYIFADPSTAHPPGTKATVTLPPTPTEMTARTTGGTTRGGPVGEQQQRELDKYRRAATRMTQDLESLRGTVRELEAQHSKLRVQVGNQDHDTSRLVLDTTQAHGGVSKAEIASKCESTKKKLAAQTGELKSYKDKVQRLQNELIKKNDMEKDYMELGQNLINPQELQKKLQEKADRARALEDRCQTQERDIEKLERNVEKLRNDSQKPKDDPDPSLTEQNRRLRQQLGEMREQLRQSGTRSPGDPEKLELYQALERAEGRIMSLEKQLQDNAREWGRERADLHTRVSENEHGFSRSGGMVLHDFPHL